MTLFEIIIDRFTISIAVRGILRVDLYDGETEFNDLEIDTMYSPYILDRKTEEDGFYDIDVRDFDETINFLNMLAIKKDTKKLGGKRYARS